MSNHVIHQERCAKCNRNDFDIEWQVSEVKECLSVKCKTCGYQWIEPTYDQRKADEEGEDG